MSLDRILDSAVYRVTDGVGLGSMDWASLKLEQRVAAKDQRCRCGTRIATGDRCYEFHGVPEAVGGLLESQAFCTPRCLRAYLLEAMEVLEGAGSPDLISDVHSVYAYLQAMSEAARDRPPARADPNERFRQPVPG